MQLKDLQAMPVDNSSDGAVAGWSTISNHCNNVALQALNIRIGNSVVHHHCRAVLRIVEEVQLIACPRHMHNILPMHATARCSRHAALS